jgi:phosphoglycolate phosphatase-like HAD superfamily hydrolase
VTEALRREIETGTEQVLCHVEARVAYFPFGSFGSDHADRDRLPSIAVERARTHTAYAYAGKNVVIIGDTEHDIRCGRSLGTLAVAVCTGTYCREDLAVHGPDVLLDDLCDTDHFVRHIALS